MTIDVDPVIGKLGPLEFRWYGVIMAIAVAVGLVVMSRELRRRGIKGGVKTVYSTEEFRPLQGGRKSADEPEAQNYQEQRAPLGSSSVVPPLFGLTMAGVVLQDLLAREAD